MNNVPHRLMYEHLVPRLFEEVMECLGGEALQEEISHEGLILRMYSLPFL